VPSKQIYHDDLAYIHHCGYGDFASKAAPELLRILGRARIRSGIIVDLGCGSGIWAKEAQRAGFRVFGIDSAPAMIRLAKKVAPRSEFGCGSLHEASIPRCDAITAIGEAFNYRPARGRMLALPVLFSKLARALPLGGMVIFDVMVAGGLSSGARVWKAGEDWAVMVSSMVTHGGRRLKRDITVFRRMKGGRFRRTRESHELELFEREEIERYLRRTGFEFKSRRAYGKMPLAKGRIAFVCRKIR
jgi:SAM-dependent methyltransferase